MPPKRRRVSSSSDSSVSDSALSMAAMSSSSPEDSDSSESSEGSEGSLSSDGSDELDPKLKFLPQSFQSKEPKVVLSKWAKSRLRSKFLGTVLSKEDRAKLTDEYYVSLSDYKLYAPGRIVDSPLMALKTQDSNAMKDVSKVHADLLFAVRIGLIPYESILELNALFEDEQKVKGRVIPAGKWANSGYSFPDDFPFPNPVEIRRNIDPKDVQDLLNRDFIRGKAHGLEILAAYALSYRLGFMELVTLTLTAHKEALSLDKIVKDLKDQMPGFSTDIANSLRLVGSCCQQLKQIRETSYLKKFDPEFQSFLKQKRSLKSNEEQVEDRVEGFTDDKLVKEVKSFSKLQKALHVVTKGKRAAAIAASKKASLAARKSSPGDGAGPSKSPGQGYRIPKKPQPKKQKKQKKEKQKKKSDSE